MEFHPHSINRTLSEAYIKSGLNLNSDDMAKLIGLQTEFIFEAYKPTPVPTDKGMEEYKTELTRLIGQVYCQPKHAKKEVDSQLLIDIVDHICQHFAPIGQGKFDVNWPEKITYYHSKKEYPQNCVEAYNQAIDACIKAYNEAHKTPAEGDEGELVELLKRSLVMLKSVHHDNGGWNLKKLVKEIEQALGKRSGK